MNLLRYIQQTTPAYGSGGSSSSRLLKGPLRVMPGGYLGDDTGYRRILLASDFPYFGLWERNNAEARRGKQALLANGFQGSRDFTLIANDFDISTQPGTYWYGCDVTKAQFRRNAVEALQYSGSLGLRTVLTFGNTPTSLNAEADWTEEWTRILRDGGVKQHIAWIEVEGNEVDVNRTRDLAFDIDVAMAHARRLQTIIRRNLPGVLLTNGSFGNESTVQDPANPNEPTLLNSADGADGLDIHNWRGVDQVHHSHTMWYETHYHGEDRRPLIEGETGGENVPYPTFQQGGDVSSPNNDASNLFTTIAMQQFTGQPTIYLNGPGVRRRYPLDSTTYFSKIARACEVLPEDIPTWQEDRNPSFFNRGNQFFYVGLAVYGQIQRPPRPIDRCTFYGLDGTKPAWTDVQGPNPIPPVDWLGGIVQGTYA